MDPVTVGTLVGAGKGLVQGKDLRGIAQDAAIGAAGGYLGGKLPFGDMFKGVTPADATSTATANSLQGGTNLLGGTTNAATNTGNLLSTPVNTGLNNVTGGVTGQGFSPYATPDKLGQSITADSLNPLYTGNVTPNFANITKSTPEELVKQTGGFTGNTGLQGNFGAVQPTDNTLGIEMQKTYGYADGNPVKTNVELGPRFDTPVKSTPEEIAAAQGGFEKPLYERAFDSVVGFAEENPVALAGLGLTALSAGNTQQPPISPRAGQAIKGTYTPTQPYKIRRAT